MYFSHYLIDEELRPNIAAMSGVTWVRPELRKVLAKYELIDDCLMGEDKIKEAGTKYLPNPDDFGVAPSSRYTSYLTRAVFYNVAGRTLEGLSGRVFTRDPIIEVPPILQPVIEDASGQGMSLDQLSQKAVAITLAKGRSGVFIDYPALQSPASAKDIASGAIKPSVHIYHPQHVINWRTYKEHGKDKFSLVVLMEPHTAAIDEFASKQIARYRVLRLVGNVYTVEIYEASETGAKLIAGPYTPRNYSGQTYDEIPFRFIGPRESSAAIEKPPLYDLCSLNIAHYRNSADYEESCFTVGQGTLVISGLTEHWVKNVLSGKIKLGGRGALPLPEGAAANLLQAEPNGQPFEAMKHKEAQMIGLGAKLIEPAQVQRTATEAEYEEAAETSVLSSVARNVSKNMEWAMQWAGYFVGVPEKSIRYDLNTDFGLSNLTPEQRGQLVREWQAEAITYSEMRAVLRRGGIATLSDEEAIKAIEKERITFAPEVDPNEEQDAKDFPEDRGEDEE
jgi:hypothetical protein